MVRSAGGECDELAVWSRLVAARWWEFIAFFFEKKINICDENLLKYWKIKRKMKKKRKWTKIDIANFFLEFLGLDTKIENVHFFPVIFAGKKRNSFIIARENYEKPQKFEFLGLDTKIENFVFLAVFWIFPPLKMQKIKTFVFFFHVENKWVFKLWKIWISGFLGLDTKISKKSILGKASLCCMFSLGKPEKVSSDTKKNRKIYFLLKFGLIKKISENWKFHFFKFFKSFSL